MLRAFVTRRRDFECFATTSSSQSSFCMTTWARKLGTRKRAVRVFASVEVEVVVVSIVAAQWNTMTSVANSSFFSRKFFVNKVNNPWEATEQVMVSVQSSSRRPRHKAEKKTASVSDTTPRFGARNNANVVVTVLSSLPLIGSCIIHWQLNKPQIRRENLSGDSIPE